MPSMTIFNADAARQAISQFSSSMSAMANICNKINSTVSGLTGEVWSGQAATTYFGKFFEMYNNLNKTQEKIDGAINIMNQAIAKYEESQELASQMANAVEEGTTPPLF